MNTIKITNVNIWGVEESQIASGYPLNSTRDLTKIEYDKKDEKRLKKLFNSNIGSGHDCATKGIIIQFDLTAPEYFWRQLDRYHFIDYVSSQSKMHCIDRFDIPSMCNECVDQRIIDVVQEKIHQNRGRREILSNVPGGFMMTARMTTNLLQLKTILNQRRFHDLIEWREFSNWIASILFDLGFGNRYEIIDEEETK